MKEKTRETDQYSLKYADYFSFYPIPSTYQYRLHIENFADNEQWPIDSCLNCKCDLQANTPVIKEFKSSPVKYFIVGILAVVLVIAPLIILIFTFVEAVFNIKSLSLIGIFISFCILLYLPYQMYKDEILKLYYCPECEALLYNNTPKKLMSQKPPREFFHSLEQIPGFKLK